MMWNFTSVKSKAVKNNKDITKYHIQNIHFQWMYIHWNGSEEPFVVHLLTKPSLLFDSNPERHGAIQLVALFEKFEHLQCLSYFLPTVYCQFYFWNIFAMCLLCPSPLPTPLIQFIFASRLGYCYNILPEHSALTQPSPFSGLPSFQPWANPGLPWTVDF